MDFLVAIWTGGRAAEAQAARETRELHRLTQSSTLRGEVFHLIYVRRYGGSVGNDRKKKVHAEEIVDRMMSLRYYSRWVEQRERALCQLPGRCKAIWDHSMITTANLQSQANGRCERSYGKSNQEKPRTVSITGDYPHCGNKKCL